MRHKHADLIHQWAEGAVIQYRDHHGIFYDVDLKIHLGHNESYRVKPGTENSGLPPGVWVGENQEPTERTQLTVREQFAMAAMQSYIGAYTNTDKQEPDDDYIVAWSFEIADAMLKASRASDE